MRAATEPDLNAYHVESGDRRLKGDQYINSYQHITLILHLHLQILLWRSLTYIVFVHKNPTKSK